MLYIAVTWLGFTLGVLFHALWTYGAGDRCAKAPECKEWIA